MTHLTPREIVSELDRFIIGQNDAKKAVAIALRNRWRRQQLSEDLRNEVLPKNILMIGPTGVGKTEIARRLAKLTNAPFIKIEATKFTEVGYVGRDVEQIIRDLVETSIQQTRKVMREQVTVQAGKNTEERILDALVGKNASAETRDKFRKMLQDSKLEDKEIEVEVADAPSNKSPFLDIPGMPGAQMGMVNLGDILGKGAGKNTKKRKLNVAEARLLLNDEESDKLLDEEDIVTQAIKSVEENGIVFLDEIDKICGQSSRRQEGGVSREGVQRDLLPLIEGTNVTTKHGNVCTDHILFISSGAFHVSKPSDLLPELQGRLPIRVEMDSLTEKDFIKILTETEASLIKQYTALLGTEKVTLEFKKDGVEELARVAALVNSNVENIGARRLHTIIEKVLEDLSFTASDKPGQTVEIDKAFVEKTVAHLAASKDLSNFIL